MKSRERFIKACNCEPLDRPPIWVMRQAGRHLPEYRALKEQYTFHQLVQTPDLAVEVTMQPIRRYGMDAAIVFSDILVIPEAMGQPYHFREQGGIQMEYAIKSAEDIEKLEPGAIRERLKYVADTLKLMREELGDETALIGFGGAPWTLATYMVEGGSSRDYRLAKELYFNNRPLFDTLMTKISDALIEYFEMQIECGVDAIQLFDSWGGVLGPQEFGPASAVWMKRVTDAIKDKVNVIVFAKNAHEHKEQLISTNPNILGASWTTDLATFRRALPDNIGVQGNLEPVLLNTSPELVQKEATRILESMRGLNGHIFNLGHGISPHAKPENMTALVETVQGFK